MKVDPFRTDIGRRIFQHRYMQGPNDHWGALSRRVVEDVCGTRWGTEPFPLMSLEDRKRLQYYIEQMKFIPGGRYLYYAGRPLHFFNNCFLLKAEEDSREEWGNLLKRCSDALMSGGGIGIDHSIIRPSGRILQRTGGISSGPLPLMSSINEHGRNVMQGGSRRSAILQLLNWLHEDIYMFLHAKDWSDEIVALKAQDYTFPAPFDQSNISISWDTEFIEGYLCDNEIPDLWYESVEQMLRTGEPGHRYNFYENEHETLTNACGEVTSEDDSDCCNLGSVNMSRIDSLAEFIDVCSLGAKFLVCGTLRGDVPYKKVEAIRAKNRRIGLGLMGIHEWLLKRNHKYEPTADLAVWLESYEAYSEEGANEICDRLYLNRPVKYRAIAPTGTIGMLASTTTGIEPLFSVAAKRRYLVDGKQWKYEFIVDATADYLIKEKGVDPEAIETSMTLAENPERRIAFQAFVQKFVDHSISSTLNLPAWGSDSNNPDKVRGFADMLLRYAPMLRGITCYPDGSRGGQPMTSVPYEEAISKQGMVFDDDEAKCGGGICGL